MMGPLSQKKMKHNLKKFLPPISILCIIALLISSFQIANRYREVPNTSFGQGERLEYRVHYGFINAAEARVDVSNSIVNVNNRPCYRVNVFGRTVGAFDLVSRVRDQWRSYIDTSAILPQMFKQEIEEGRFRKEETVLFNHGSNVVYSSVKDEKKSFKAPNNIHDVISGYYYLRTVNFDRMSVGQAIEVPTFFNGDIFPMKVRYKGKDEIKTKFGRIKVLKLNPIMPDNKFFKGEESINIWVSDDVNKVPVKIEVKLWIGSLDMDLKSYKGLQSAMEWM